MSKYVFLLNVVVDLFDLKHTAHHSHHFWLLFISSELRMPLLAQNNEQKHSNSFHVLHLTFQIV